MPGQINIRYCEIKIKTVFIVISIQAVEGFISARVWSMIFFFFLPVIFSCSISQEALKGLQLGVSWRKAVNLTWLSSPGVIWSPD